jgi:hypothetical protein
MKLPFLGAIAFVVGTAGASGAVVMLGKKPETATAPHDSTGTAADSTARTDSVHAAPDSAVHQLKTPTPQASETTAVVVPASASPGSAAPSAPSAPSVSLASPPRDFARLAKLLSAMPAPQAAELLGFLDDGDVEGVLRALGLRQAAGILGALPKPRAAIMSRRLLMLPSVGESR